MMVRLLNISPMGTFEDKDGRFFKVIRHEGVMSEVVELSTKKYYAWPYAIKVKLIIPKFKTDGSES